MTTTKVGLLGRRIFSDAASRNRLLECGWCEWCKAVVLVRGAGGGGIASSRGRAMRYGVGQLKQLDRRGRSRCCSERNDCCREKDGGEWWRVIEGERPLSSASVERMSGWRILTRRRATLTTETKGRCARRRESSV